MPTLEGTLERITFHSASDGYTVARLMPHDKGYTVTVVGKAPAKVEVYDGRGHRVGLSLVKAPGTVQVRVVAGGFTIVRR